MSPRRSPPIPTLAQRAWELRGLKLPGSMVAIQGGQVLRFRFSLSPGLFGRLYDCELRVFPGEKPPQMFVLRPDLIEVAGGRRPPHLYDHDGRGCLLCLWWPKNGEWHPHHKLGSSYIAWTGEWLWYYEEWLKHDEWLAGGAHPVRVPCRWSPGRFRHRSSRMDR